jgi:hypothetical protein
MTLLVFICVFTVLALLVTAVETGIDEITKYLRTKRRKSQS